MNNSINLTIYVNNNFGIDIHEFFFKTLRKNYPHLFINSASHDINIETKDGVLKLEMVSIAQHEDTMLICSDIMRILRYVFDSKCELNITYTNVPYSYLIDNFI